MDITLTGIDAQTNMLKLPKGVEIGILFSANPKERPRYPERNIILGMQSILAYHGFRRALHVCGSAARRMLLEGTMFDILNVERIQVNGRVSVEELSAICRKYTKWEIITQHTRENSVLLDERWPNHSVLVDASGGRGISPREWERPITDKRVGYAGGLGPDNIVEEVEKIRSVASENFWIDMENKLRDENDLFSVEKANAVASLCKEWLTC